jgi:hypothetical protein
MGYDKWRDERKIFEWEWSDPQPVQGKMDELPMPQDQQG